MRFIFGMTPKIAINGKSSNVAAFLVAFQISFTGMEHTFMLSPLQFVVPKSMKAEAYK